MRLTNILAVTFLPAIALAAKQSSKDRFAEAYAKAQPIKLIDQSYDALTAMPRDYSVAVLLTAQEKRFACQLCQEFKPEWELLAKSWTRGDEEAEGRLLFGTLDFMDGKGTFQSLQLQTAPVLLLFHPTVGPYAKADKPMERLDFNNGINRADAVHQWLSRRLPDRPHPALVRPMNYGKITVTITAALGVITFLTVAAPYIMPFIQNRNIWAAISLLSVLLFTSGHMFNHIRKVPYAQPDGKGGINYFAPGFQMQFGMETQIVAAIYGVLSFATISLALKVPRIADPRSQGLGVLLWGGVILFMYSFLLSVFRLKNGGYPFWLPPF